MILYGNKCVVASLKSFEEANITDIQAIVSRFWTNISLTENLKAF